MKAIEILMFVLIIVLIYPGINYLKNASIKTFKSSKGKPPSKYTGDDYYQPKTIWNANPDEKTAYKYKGTSVSGSGFCRVYTYESALVTQKTDKHGMINLLSNYSFVKPNINNALQDYVDGNSHLTGKISTEGSDASDMCVDSDQINVKYATKTCNQDNSNKCLDDNGFELKPGEKFNYTSDCNFTPCDGQVGCISLNYHNSENNIDLNTQCISIEGISVGEKTGQIYDLSFWREINIINTEKVIPDSGPFPIKLGFNICDNTDARQKLRLTRYSYLDGTDPSKPGVSGFVPDPAGSYSSIIFRGLNSYLDMSDNSDGSFVLKEIKNDPKEGIKWILFPETELMKKTVPSVQRCAALSSNMVGESGLDGLLQGKNTMILGEAGLTLKVLSNIQSMGKKGYASMIKFLKNRASGGGEDKDFSINFKNPAFDEEAAKGAESATKIDEVVAESESLLDNIYNPGTWILLILTAISLLVPNPSYSSPPINSYGVEKNMRVGPTNFLGQVTERSKPVDNGQANVTPIEHFCLPRELPVYPPYFLECLSDGQKISNKYINYDYSLGYSISASNVLNTGTTPAQGLYIWNSPNNLGGVSGSINSIWQDGDAAWNVKNTLSEAIIYPSDYFTESTFNFVSDFTYNSLNKRQYPIKISPPTGYEKSSESGLISSLNLSSKDTIKQMNTDGRLPGVYEAADTGPNGSGKFLASVDYSPTSLSDSSTKITEIAISKEGSGYKVNDTITLNYLDIGGSIPSQGLSFGVSQTATEVFTLKALSYYGLDDSKPQKPIYLSPTASTYSPSAGTEVNVKSRGFELAATSNSNSILLYKEYKQRAGDAKATGIISGGEGYSIGDNIYLAQYIGDTQPDWLAEHDKQTPTTPIDITTAGVSLIKLQVTDISSSGYGTSQVSPIKLYTDTSFNLSYNFMDNSKNTFDSSPPQIVYGGYTDNFIQDFAKNFKGKLTSDNVYQYFLSSKLRDQTSGLLQTEDDFSALKLKSIQINDFKYQKSGMDAELVPPPIKNQDIVLGRFIPYKSFSPAVLGTSTGAPQSPVAVYDSYSNKMISTDFQLGYTANELYTNWNYTQFIPCGVHDVYLNKNFILNPPKF